MPKYNFNLFSYFSRNKRSKMSKRPVRCGPTKTRKQRGGNIQQIAQPKKRMLIGKIYADWCGYCISLNKEWSEMQNMIKHNMGRSLKHLDIEFVEIGDTKENKAAGKTVDGLLKEFNKKHMSKSVEKLALDGGYPTIFKYCHGKLEYYKGERTAKEIYDWTMLGC